MNEIIRKLSLAGNKRPVTNKDMSQIENKLGIVIPDDMKAFYLCLNGTGVLGLDVECMFHSPITGLDYEISHFISFKYGGAQFTIDGGASIARIEENRASNLLVFAIAEDHSRFVIDVKTGNIYNYKHKEIKWYYTKEGRQIFFDKKVYCLYTEIPCSQTFFMNNFLYCVLVNFPIDIRLWEDVLITLREQNLSYKYIFNVASLNDCQDAE